jgi:hypothetical protein
MVICKQDKYYLFILFSLINLLLLNPLMKNLSIKDYPNFFDHFSITPIEIENQIIQFPLSFLKERNKTVEWKIQFLMFLHAFYRFLWMYKKVPQQEECFNFYLEINNEYFEKNKYADKIMAGLKARFFRAYPSLVRDLHFSSYLNHHFAEAEIIYNRQLDIREGIDVLIIYNNHYFAVSLYISTMRAFAGRIKKTTRHQSFKNVTYIDLPVDFKDSTSCGNFFLYGSNEYEKVYKLISNIYKAKQNNSVY